MELWPRIAGKAWAELAGLAWLILAEFTYISVINYGLDGARWFDGSVEVTEKMKSLSLGSSLLLQLAWVSLYGDSRIPQTRK